MLLRKIVLLLAVLSLVNPQAVGNVGDGCGKPAGSSWGDVDCGQNCRDDCEIDVEITSITMAERLCIVTLELSVECGSGESCSTTVTKPCDDQSSASITCGGCCISVTPNAGGVVNCQGSDWEGVGSAFRCACYTVSCSEGACS